MIIALESKAQDSIQNKIVHWKVIINYSPSIFYQEPGIAINYRMKNDMILEGRYNYLFWGYHLFLLNKGETDSHYWIVHGNVFRLSLKGFKKQIFKNKYFNEVRLTYKDVISGHYCWEQGPSGIGMQERETRSDKIKLLSVIVVFTNPLLKGKYFNIDTFLNLGFAYGEKTVYQLKYGLDGDCDTIDFPEGTHFVKPVYRPSVDFGLNFSFNVINLR